MEDGLRDTRETSIVTRNEMVLILVVVEDGLRDILIISRGWGLNVLILVVVEDGLRVHCQEFLLQPCDAS